MLATWSGDDMLTKHVFLGLGSNLGDRETHLEDAICALGSHGSFNITALSSVLETEPMGNEKQGKFLNAVVEIETTMSPRELLHACLDIEIQQGRVRKGKWGPRTIDIDILFFSDQLIQEDGLHIPHPEVHNRSFALLPMAEIAADFIHPLLKRDMKAMSSGH